MSNKTLLVVIIALTVITVCVQWAIKEKPSEDRVADISNYIRDTTWWQGKYAPPLELTLLDGSTLKLADHVGKKIIILNFFTTWCEPCRMEIPELNSYYQKRQTNDLMMIGINVEEKVDLVKQFTRNQKISFTVGIDTRGEIAKRYRVKSYPTTVVIGADGKVALFQIGAIANADVVFDSLLRIHQDLIKRSQGVNPATYLRLAEASIDQDTKGHTPKPKVILSGPAKEFASRMRCPSCHKSLLDCQCDFCESVVKNLFALDVKDKTDEQILKALFLETK